MPDPLKGTAWSEAVTVAGFAQSAPNQTLMRFAAEEGATGRKYLLDIGCGAGRNAVPLAKQGWSVTGIDLSWPMLRAAAERAQAESLTRGLQMVLAPMERLPIAPASMDFIVAHGIWNLAQSKVQFQAAQVKPRAWPSLERRCSCSPFRGQRCRPMLDLWTAKSSYSLSSPGQRSAS